LRRRHQADDIYLLDEDRDTLKKYVETLLDISNYIGLEAGTEKLYVNVSSSECKEESRWLRNP
jgi:hypothetical protein